MGKRGKGTGQTGLHVAYVNKSGLLGPARYAGHDIAAAREDLPFLKLNQPCQTAGRLGDFALQPAEYPFFNGSLVSPRIGTVYPNQLPGQIPRFPVQTDLLILCGLTYCGGYRAL